MSEFPFSLMAGMAMGLTFAIAGLLWMIQGTGLSSAIVGYGAAGVYLGSLLFFSCTYRVLTKLLK